jgi:hypothetical protein
MQLKFNKKILFLGLLIPGFFWASIAKAVCPVCVVVVGAGLGLSRWFGVDDTISSLWIGALLWAISVWTVSWVKTKTWNFKYSSIVIFLAYYILVLVPLYTVDVIGHPLNTIFGIDKIIFGTIIGTLVIWGATVLHNYLKTKNNGKSFFNYQKVVLPVAVLLIASIIFYYLLY